MKAHYRRSREVVSWPCPRSLQPALYLLPLCPQPFSLLPLSLSLFCPPRPSPPRPVPGQRPHRVRYNGATWRPPLYLQRVPWGRGGSARWDSGGAAGDTTDHRRPGRDIGGGNMAGTGVQGETRRGVPSAPTAAPAGRALICARPQPSVSPGCPGMCEEGAQVPPPAAFLPQLLISRHIPPTISTYSLINFPLLLLCPNYLSYGAIQRVHSR